MKRKKFAGKYGQPSDQMVTIFNSAMCIVFTAPDIREYIS
jgi:hypothetical protein